MACDDRDSDFDAATAREAASASDAVDAADVETVDTATVESAAEQTVADADAPDDVAPYDTLDPAGAGLEALRQAVAAAIEARAAAKRRRAAIFDDVETFGDLGERVGTRCVAAPSPSPVLDIYAIYDAAGAERSTRLAAASASRRGGDQRSENQRGEDLRGEDLRGEDLDGEVGRAAARRREALDRDLLEMGARARTRHVPREPAPSRRAPPAPAPEAWRRMLRALRETLDAEAAIEKAEPIGDGTTS